jgi:transcription initiation factor TFIIB
MLKPNEHNNNNATQNLTKCSLCKSGSVITDPESAELVCSNCGMVFSDGIQEGKQESGVLLNNVQNGGGDRTGIPVSITKDDVGLSTVISRTNKDVNGRAIEQGTTLFKR